MRVFSDENYKTGSSYVVNERLLSIDPELAILLVIISHNYGGTTFKREELLKVSNSKKRIFTRCEWLTNLGLLEVTKYPGQGREKGVFGRLDVQALDAFYTDMLESSKKVWEVKLKDIRYLRHKKKVLIGVGSLQNVFDEVFIKRLDAIFDEKVTMRQETINLRKHLGHSRDTVEIFRRLLNSYYVEIKNIFDVFFLDRFKEEKFQTYVFVKFMCLLYDFLSMEQRRVFMYIALWSKDKNLNIFTNNNTTILPKDIQEVLAHYLSKEVKVLEKDLEDFIKALKKHSRVVPVSFKFRDFRNFVQIKV